MGCSYRMSSGSAQCACIGCYAVTHLGIGVQAATKLLLAEGSKVVMVAFQSSRSQGIYGLVSNLGSLVVRTIFQVCLPCRNQAKLRSQD